MHRLLVLFATILFATGTAARADGIISKVVSSPMTAASTVKGARLGINVYLQHKDSPGLAFMDPAVPGYGIPAGGRIEVELSGGFERDPSIPLDASGIILVSGAPQQGLPGKKLGYRVREGDARTFVIEATRPAGLTADDLLPPTPGAAQDPVRQRGLKVLHIGFRRLPFINSGTHGIVTVRFIDAAGKRLYHGEGKIAFLEQPLPQIHPTNIIDGRRNHNWQRIGPGETLGQKAGTVPLAFLMFEQAVGVPAQHLNKFKLGIRSAGVLSSRQLAERGYRAPKLLSRYTGGLIIQDTSGDGKLDPTQDQIIGGVIGAAPPGAVGHDLRSIEYQGHLVLSELLANIMPKIGQHIGGSVMVLQFTAGDKPGLYQPTVALLKDPARPEAGDGSHYTYTIVVE